MPLGFQLAVAAVLGFGLGLLLGWLWGRGRRGAENELRQQLGQRESELTQLRRQLTEATNSNAAEEAGRTAAEKLAVEQRAWYERAMQEAKESQSRALTDLREAFKALSAEALKQTHPELVRLANETFGRFQEAAKGDLTQRQEAIKGLVDPLKQHLETYQKRLQQSETAQSAALGEVRKQLEMLAQQSQSLATETQQFRMVLKSNQARGRWGEETLRRIVEVSGLSAHCDFTQQVQAGDSKPDLLVHLPGDRIIVVDAKVPDLDFLSAIDTAEPTKRSELLAAHALKLKSTIKSLADRDYPSRFPNALDYVILFLPAESLFSAALEGDRDLMVWAQGKRIILATPSSLFAILRSVSLSWQQHSQTENARAIADAAQDLFTRVCKFTDHFQDIGGALAKANNAFNDALRSYDRMVRPSGERLMKLGGSPEGKKLAEPKVLETGQQNLL